MGSGTPNQILRKYFQFFKFTIFEIDDLRPNEKILDDLLGRISFRICHGIDLIFRSRRRNSPRSSVTYADSGVLVLPPLTQSINTLNWKNEAVHSVQYFHSQKITFILYSLPQSLKQRTNLCSLNSTPCMKLSLSFIGSPSFCQIRQQLKVDY